MEVRLGLLLIFLFILLAVVAVKYITVRSILRQQKLLAENTERLNESRAMVKVIENTLQVEQRRESECNRSIERLNKETGRLEDELWKIDQAEQVEAELTRQKLEGLKDE